MRTAEFICHHNRVLHHASCRNASECIHLIASINLLIRDLILLRFCKLYFKELVKGINKKQRAIQFKQIVTK